MTDVNGRVHPLRMTRFSEDVTDNRSDSMGFAKVPAPWPIDRRWQTRWSQRHPGLWTYAAQLVRNKHILAWLPHVLLKSLAFRSFRSES